MFIFVLKQVVDAFERFGFQLIYKIIQSLEPRNVYHTIVVWWVRNLDANPKNTHKYGRQMRALYKKVVTLTIRVALCYFLKHSEHHSNKRANQVNFLHNALNKGVLLSKLQLVLLKRVVQSHNIIVERKHVCVDSPKQFLQAWLYN